MASAGVNVFRWSALVVGVFYGFSHQSAITARDKAAHARHEYEHKQDLITKAKEQYKRKMSPASTNVVSDIEDPNFDFEKYIATVEAKS